MRGLITITVLMLAAACAQAGTFASGAAPLSVAGYALDFPVPQRRLSFEPNPRRSASPIKFRSLSGAHTILLTPNEAVLAVKSASPAGEPGSGDHAGSGEAGSGWETLRVRLEGSNPDARLSGLLELPGNSHDWVGSYPVKWRRDDAAYAGVRYREVYPGVDLVVSGNQQQLEHGFIVAPGANPESIRLVFGGAEAVVIDSHGNLVLQTPSRELRLKKPDVYQETAGTRVSLSGRYVVKSGRIGIDVSVYDPAWPLIIDPVLVFASNPSNAGDGPSGEFMADWTGKGYE